MSRRPAAVLAQHRKVYIARFGQYLKVGCSVYPASRIESMRYDNTAKPSDLDRSTRGALLHVTPGGFDDELEVMGALYDHRVTGEWFRANDESLAVVAALAASP